MRILIVTSHFFPENFKANDMAFELARRGHEVTVLAPIPDYPQGKYHEGYGVFKKRREIVNSVKVIRTFVVPRHEGSAKWLALNYLSHTFFSSVYALWLGIFQKFDSIIVHETSPVMVGIPAVFIKKIQKIPLHFWVLDLWPESLKAAGGINNPGILNLFGKLTGWLYKNSNTILTSSKGFRYSICRLGDFKSKIKYFPNWIDSSFSKNYPGELPSIPKGFNVIFTGNIGDAQDMPNLMKAAAKLRDKNINILLFGNGRKKEWVRDFITDNSLNNVYLMGSYPLEAMPQVFSKADILFLALTDNQIFHLTVPAKLQAYMSSGKPVVAMINGEGADLIKEADCGWSVPAEDPEALADLLLKLSKEDPDLLEQKGMNGKLYSEKHFRFKDCMDNLEKIIAFKSE